MSTNDYSYLFDQIGNRIEADEAGDEWSYIANALNQYVTITNNSSPVSIAHDDDGNMTTAPLSSFGTLLSTDLGWNGENRLITASNSSMTASYNYDYIGRRFEKSVVTNSITNTTTFVYDGWNLVSETTVNSELGTSSTNLYIWGLDLSQSLQGAGGIGGLLCVIENGTPYYPATDANGNITDYVDASGTVVAHREFDPFGNTIVATGPKVNDFRFWFSSKYLDAETGLYYYGCRHYSPTLARWISRDPIWELGSFLWKPSLDTTQDYRMLDNNVVNKVDLLGLEDLGWVKWKTKNRRRAAAACPCDPLEVNKKGCKAALDAYKLTKEHPKPPDAAFVMFNPEYCGRVCCNQTTKEVDITGPIQGPWPEILSRDIAGHWQKIYGDGKPTCNPTDAPAKALGSAPVRR